jgi:SAM-dependent methyltransferase
MRKVANHYERVGLLEEVKLYLERKGLTGKTLSSHELASLDQFHSRGLEATESLAHELRLSPSERVLDVGSGLGGPARYIAATYGCSVRGIDLTPSYVEVSRLLTECSGLQDKVDFDCGDALKLPYAAESFDAVMTLHTAMNIGNRLAFYSEIHRVLRPGGRFGMYDVLAGQNQPIRFPVPWADTPDTSFLLKAAELQEVLGDLGFQLLRWTDFTSEGITWHSSRKRGPEGEPVGLDLVIGTEFKTKSHNFGANLQEGRIQLVEAVFERN